MTQVKQQQFLPPEVLLAKLLIPTFSDS